MTASAPETSRRWPDLLRVDELVAGYHSPVVGPISFSVARGEVLGLWGANGSGKSTLLNAIGRGARVFGGTATLVPGTRLAYQEQQPVRLPLMPLTGRDLLRVADAEYRATAAVFSTYLNQRVDSLSGGQYQLICVWAALGSDADLILLDEPTNNLDPSTESLLIQLLATERHRRAVLLVSHERRFLDAACSRVITIDTPQDGAR